MVTGMLSISLKTYKKNLYVCELREIAQVVEDRIRYEINNSMGIDTLLEDNKKVYEERYLKEAYKKICRVGYRKFELKNINDRDYKVIQNSKFIDHRSRTMYIYKGRFPYQIGNYVDEMFVREREFPEKVEYDFVIIYSKNKYKYVSKFTIYTDK